MNWIAIITFILSFNVLGKNNDISFSDSTIPYIQKYSNLSVKNSFNNELTTILNTLKCSLKKKVSNSFWENYTRVAYNQNDILSIKIRSNYNCDGLYPHNDIDHSITYDLKNNRKVTLFDIFLKKDDTYKLIRSSLYSQVQNKDCKDKVNFYIESEKLFKEYLVFFFDEKGIVFKLKLPYGLRFCMKDALISYQDILSQSSYTGVLKYLENDKKLKK